MKYIQRFAEWTLEISTHFLDWIGPKCIKCVECEYFMFAQIESVALTKFPNQRVGCSVVYQITTPVQHFSGLKLKSLMLQ